MCEHSIVTARMKSKTSQIEPKQIQPGEEEEDAPSGEREAAPVTGSGSMKGTPSVPPRQVSGVRHWTEAELQEKVASAHPSVLPAGAQSAALSPTAPMPNEAPRYVTLLLIAALVLITKCCNDLLDHVPAINKPGSGRGRVRVCQARHVHEDNQYTFAG